MLSSLMAQLGPLMALAGPMHESALKNFPGTFHATMDLWNRGAVEPVVLWNRGAVEPVDLWICGAVQLWICGTVEPWSRGTCGASNVAIVAGYLLQS